MSVKNECVRLKNILLEMEIATRNKELISRVEVHRFLGETAKIIRDAGESVCQEFGVDAQRILTEALEDVLRKNDAFFNSATHVNGDSSATDDPGNPS